MLSFMIYLFIGSILKRYTGDVNVYFFLISMIFIILEIGLEVSIAVSRLN